MTAHEINRLLRDELNERQQKLAGALDELRIIGGALEELSKQMPFPSGNPFRQMLQALAKLHRGQVDEVGRFRSPLTVCRKPTPVRRFAA